ncbi:hypothetical protein A5760_01995 [Mycobacterium colombiense]|uniref:IrrE N-terminal-like domain-containing protein n=1 Tax=Mycobacterium colombiense TaxID=339268 RepID=A0A1A0VXT8_9MYCO|nr:hypothetical protein [Mycobacterium colombiense]OBB88042.1 hypothetical protein A5760_01995 [Mycobacterium colombiense]
MASKGDMLALVRTLPVPVPWDRAAFIDGVAGLRGRPIRLVPTVDELALGPCGVWLKRDEDDIIIHEAGTSEYHIDQIVCHEIGHMVLEHDGGSRGDAEHYPKMIFGSALAGFDAGTGVILGRTSFDDDRERDAEMFASLVMLAAAEAGARPSMMSSVFFRR